VCGPKSSGKSTFSRLLANRLVTEDSRPRNKSWPGVAVLDIDPGQPEFSTPGHLSLVHVNQPNLSPPFCRPFSDRGNTKVIRSHALASVSPAADPDHYVECVLDLYATYQRSLKGRCPLIINTPGWVQGTGLDLLTELVAKLRPSGVIYMSLDGPEETVEGLKSAMRGAAFTELPSQPSEYTSRTALHLRTMHTMSYFHIDTASLNQEHLRWGSEPLIAAPPLLVRYGGRGRGILGVMCYDYQPPLHLLAEALNGNLVSIVEIEDKAAFERLQNSKSRGDDAQVEDGTAMDLDEDSGDDGPGIDMSSIEESLVKRSPEGLPLLHNPSGRALDPRYSQVVGTALIRGIDTEQRTLQLLCPLPLDTIDRVTKAGHQIVLVSGKLDSPSWAYTEDLYKRAFNSTSRNEAEDEPMESTEADTDEDASDAQGDDPNGQEEQPGIPWVEVLRGNQKRAVGSRVWRVRRDLGRSGNTTD